MALNVWSSLLQHGKISKGHQQLAICSDAALIWMRTGYRYIYIKQARLQEQLRIPGRVSPEPARLPCNRCVRATTDLSERARTFVRCAMCALRSGARAHVKMDIRNRMRLLHCMSCLFEQIRVRMFAGVYLGGYQMMALSLRLFFNAQGRSRAFKWFAQTLFTWRPRQLRAPRLWQ